MRAIFGEHKSEEFYGELLEYVPIVILTFESFYKGEKAENRSKFILQFTKSGFSDFISFLKSSRHLERKSEKERTTYSFNAQEF